jgi:type IV secretion system protein VirB10
MGVTGFEDEVNNHWGQLIGAGILTTVFNIPAVAANYSQQQAQGYPEFNNPGVGRTIGNSALSSMGKVAQQIGGKMTDRAMNIKPTITINAGYQFRVLVTKDIVIPPYERKM